LRRRPTPTTIPKFQIEGHYGSITLIQYQRFQHLLGSLAKEGLQPILANRATNWPQERPQLFAEAFSPSFFSPPLQALGHRVVAHA
jgi:hypothetical protein